MKSGQNVLIVDDNAENIRLAAGSLKSLDISILFATNGFRAIEIIEEQDIDLILMDINMPKMDGFETVKKMNTNIPIIFLTAIDDKQAVLKAFHYGGVDYITKPFFPEELLLRVSTQLKLSALNKNLLKEVDKKSEELKKSMFINHSTNTYNASQLQLDLLKSKRNVGAMIHIKKIQQYEIAFGLENIEKILSDFVKWINLQKGINVTLYHIAYSDFICLFDTNDINEVELWSLKILDKLKYQTFNIIDGSPIHLNTTISIATGKEKQLIQHLRIAQIEAQNKNKNYYFYEQEGMDIIKEQTKNLYWVDFLIDSIKQDKLVPFYQPIVETNTGKIIKYECLARIKDGNNVISPCYFIEAAKQLGVITQITKIILEKACKAIANTKLGISINITKDDLIESYLSKMLLELTNKYNISKSQITLEVLEEISVFGTTEVVNELLKLKKEGYKIALDDFGSENASFSRMLDLNIDIIKIDGMFIKNITKHKNSRLIVEGIAYMAKLFDYEIVAEYVHNKEVVDILKSLGINYSQGYYFSEPLEYPNY